MKKIAAVLAIMVGLAYMAALAVTEPLLPDADDCVAQGKDEECWRER